MGGWSGASGTSGTSRGGHFLVVPGMMASRPSILALTKPGPLRLFNTTELLRLPPPRWLVQDILPAGGLVGLYGPPGAGKSFIAIDLALAVASGKLWHGHSVEQGFALYVSGEGGTGIGKRVQAWLSSNQASTNDVNIAWLTESMPISSTSEDMDVLFGRLNDEIEQSPSLVVIDTLARCFDGDENLQEDMGRFIAGVDRLRREFRATVIVVHHTRLDAERERGSTAFRGAADTMLSVARKVQHGSIELVCNKQKDAEEFGTLWFDLKVVPVTMRGVADTSCIVESQAQSRSAAILAMLAQGPCTFSEFRRGRFHIPKTSLHRGLLELAGSGQIIKENGVYRLARFQDK